VSVLRRIVFYTIHRLMEVYFMTTASCGWQYCKLACYCICGPWSVVDVMELYWMNYNNKLPCLGLCLGLCNACLILVMFR
jgi:hypothetical protein